MPTPTVANPRTWAWPEVSGSWVAFGTLAEQEPPTGIIKCHVWSFGDVEAFSHGPRGKVFYRFKCTPLVCGNPNCQAEGRGRVMMNFAPPGWIGTHGPGFRTHENWQTGSLNPMDLDYNGPLKDQAFFVVLGNQLVWNSSRWGQGPPEGWGVHS